MPGAGTLQRMRRKSAELMVDQCTVTRAGRPAYDKTSSTTSVAPADTIYRGRCRVTAAFGEQRPDVAGEPVTQHDYIASLPYDAPEIEVEDRLTVTVSSDRRLVNRSLRVAGVVHRSLAVNRRLRLVDDLG